MNRGILYASGGISLCLAAIGWLWSENQSLRDQLAERSDSGRIRTDASVQDRRTATTREESKTSSTPTRRKPLKSPGPVRLRSVESAEKPRESEDKNTVPVAAPGEAGGMNRTTEAPDEGQPGGLNPRRALPPAGNRESLLKNGGFERGLDPWNNEKCAVVRERGHDENSVLEVSLEDEGFQLDQSFHWPADQEDLTLSLRVRRPETMAKARLSIPFHLLDEEGRKVYVSAAQFETSGDWTTRSITLAFPREIPKPTSIGFSNPGGEGKLWIDDVTLK